MLINHSIMDFTPASETAAAAAAADAAAEMEAVETVVDAGVVVEIK